MTGALLLARLDLPKPHLEVPPIISLMFPSLTFNTLENVVTAMIGIGVSAFAARVVYLVSPQASLTRELSAFVLLSIRFTLLL
ncbi:MAG: hypothetical protein JWN30_1077, partial [Bacilli bacterium]|nr:hypothetical protein [Bacilli bacterium]